MKEMLYEARRHRLWQWRLLWLRLWALRMLRRLSRLRFRPLRLRLRPVRRLWPLWMWRRWPWGRSGRGQEAIEALLTHEKAAELTI